MCDVCLDIRLSNVIIMSKHNYFEISRGRLRELTSYAVGHISIAPRFKGPAALVQNGVSSFTSSLYVWRYPGPSRGWQTTIELKTLFQMTRRFTDLSQ